MAAEPTVPKRILVPVTLPVRLSVSAGSESGLGISTRTVQTHLARVYSKLGISGRHQLAARLAGEPVAT